MLNQNSFTLRGKINEKCILPNFCLSIFLVCKLLFPTTKLFDNNADLFFFFFLWNRVCYQTCS